VIRTYGMVLKREIVAMKTMRLRALVCSLPLIDLLTGRDVASEQTGTESEGLRSWVVT
jgi:hypothetical protein